MSYGRHQSFYLKRHWINKGINAITIFGECIFFEKEKYKFIGLGKNMHQSLRYWLEATNILQPLTENKTHVLTHFGNLVKNYDSSCTNNLTLCLIHYFLSIDSKPNNTEKSDANYWFFNEYEENLFTKDKLRVDLILWDGGKTSENTISKEIDCLISTYTNDDRSHPEDKNVSLLAPLVLIRKQGNYYIKSSLDRKYFSNQAFYYILLVMKENFIPLTIDNIVSHKNTVGKLFNLGRVDVIDIIEDMKKENYLIDITRTNNLDTVKITASESSKRFLEKCYKGGIS